MKVRSNNLTGPASRFDLVIFDLDGTLIDSRMDLANSVNAARAHMKMGPLAHELIFSYVGNGAPVLIRRAMGEDASDAECAEALEFFIQDYRAHCLDFTRLYPGVAESLDRLRGRVKLAVLTNKPVRISEAIVDGLGLTSTFFRVYGGNSFEEKKPHPIGIDRLREESGSDGRRTLMVGDSRVDIETARNAGVASLGVSYGFQPETLHTPAPDFVVDNGAEIATIILAAS